MRQIKSKFYDEKHLIAMDSIVLKYKIKIRFNCCLYGQSVGDTDATLMLEATCDLLETSEDYLNADVLWISDFCIPLVEPQLIDRMQSFRTQGTRFYGLQIGEYTNRWKPYLDEIAHIGYTPTRRY